MCVDVVVCSKNIVKCRAVPEAILLLFTSFLSNSDQGKRAGVSRVQVHHQGSIISQVPFFCQGQFLLSAKLCKAELFV